MPANALDVFVDRHCTQHLAARCHLSQFLSEFRASLPKKDRSRWTRTRVIAALTKRGHAIGTDSASQAVIVGLVPGRGWSVDGVGKIVLVHG